MYTALEIFLTKITSYVYSVYLKQLIKYTNGKY